MGRLFQGSDIVIGISRTIRISQTKTGVMSTPNRKRCIPYHIPIFGYLGCIQVCDIGNHVSVNIFMHRHFMWINSRDWDVWAKTYECFLVLSQNTVVLKLPLQTFCLHPFQYWNVYSWLLSNVRVRGADHLLEENLCIIYS